MLLFCCPVRLTHFHWAAPYCIMLPSPRSQGTAVDTFPFPLSCCPCCNVHPPHRLSCRINELHTSMGGVIPPVPRLHISGRQPIVPNSVCFVRTVFLYSHCLGPHFSPFFFAAPFTTMFAHEFMWFVLGEGSVFFLWGHSWYWCPRLLHPPQVMGCPS